MMMNAWLALATMKYNNNTMSVVVVGDCFVRGEDVVVVVVIIIISSSSLLFYYHYH